MYSTNRVIGTVADDSKARAAIDALLRAGFGREDIDILHDEKDLKRLDPAGTEHGFLAQFQRTLIRALDLEEFKHLTHHVEDVRAGRYVIMVLMKRRVQRTVAADILHQHGAEFVGFYGRWACEELPNTAQRSPQDIPGLFARAWNARDPDALASLFDEDAEFVDIAGLVWHDRESIRKHGLGHLVNNSVMTIDEMKVKLLSSNTAVVHARMTLTGEESAGTAGQPAPRTAIVSFVVHRIGERWQCASVQSTDVIPNAAANVVGAGDGFRVANYPSGQAS
jgi:uncharacterized protein (TIGR02246 family)